MNDLNDDQKLMIYALGVVHEMKAEDLVKGNFSLDPGSLEVYTKLKASGYKPDTETLAEAVAFLRAEKRVPDRDYLSMLVTDYLIMKDPK